MSSPAKPTKILLLSDDFTPMEFVVDVLAGIFKLTKEQAIEAMLNTH
jgi:ATP-dependent Clp protease adaptor protein ClpS